MPQLLPFKVQPKAVDVVDIGNEQIGVLSLPKMNDLSVLERRFIKSENPFDLRRSIAELAQRVSKEAGAKFVYVYDRIGGYLYGSSMIVGDAVKIVSDDKQHKAIVGKTAKILKIEEREGIKIALIKLDEDAKEIALPLELLQEIDPEWFGSFYTEILELETSWMASIEATALINATAIIRYRLHPNPILVTEMDQVMQQLAEELKTTAMPASEQAKVLIKIKTKLEDENGVWSLRHTSNPNLLHPELVNEIAGFAVKEANHWKVDEPTPPEPTTEEALGNSSAE